VPATYEYYNKFYWKSSDNVYHLIEDEIALNNDEALFNATSAMTPAFYYD
jgi:hypothetical protein